MPAIKIPCHVKSKICSVEELRRLQPGLEEAFWRLEKGLQEVENVSWDLYGTCGNDSPLWSGIECVLDSIAATGRRYDLTTDFYRAYFQDEANRRAHGVPAPSYTC